MQVFVVTELTGLESDSSRCRPAELRQRDVKTCLRDLARRASMLQAAASASTREGWVWLTEACPADAVTGSAQLMR